MKMTSYLILLLIMSTLLGATSIIVLPSTIEYSIFNEGETGFSELMREYGGEIITSPAKILSIDPLGSVIVTSNIGPASPSIVEKLVVFVEKGGVLIATGDSAYLNSLAEGFGLPQVSKSKVVYDMVYNQGDRFKPVGYSRVCNCNVSLWKPFASDLTEENVLIETSSFSYLDTNENGFLDLDEPIGVFPVGIIYKYHNGTVYLIFSTRVFTNDLLEFNKEFLECLKGGRILYIDQINPADKPFENLRFVAFKEGSVVFAGILAVIIVLVMLYVHDKK